jgi:REP element-mobilizing transposase RayT
MGDEDVFLLYLKDVIERHAWTCFAYCLMPNHFHLVVQTPQDDISRGMHRLNSRYAQWFNDTHQTDGHLFQDRFFSVIVDVEEHLVELLRYTALNPVRAGLCAVAEDWRWSSHAAVVGARPRPRFLAVDSALELFARRRADARRAYAAFVAADAPIVGARAAA